MKDLKDFINSMLNIRSGLDIAFNFCISALTFIFTYATQFVITNQAMFVMITVVVLGDFFFGVIANRRNFQTKKALKVVWYFVAYNLLAYIVLIIEKAHPAAFWLSETVIMPIMTFQVISIVKNMRKSGVIPSSLLDQILSKIDQHKDDGNKD